MESLYFMFDGVKSSDYGVYRVRSSDVGAVELPLMGSRTTIKHTTPRRLRPDLFGIEKEPLHLTLELALMDGDLNLVEWTPAKTREIARWLVHDDYKELRLGENLDRYHYAICVDETSKFVVNDKGYLVINFETNSPYAWSKVYIDEFDLSNNTGKKIIELSNKSNILKYYRPLIQIELVNNTTDVSLTNLTNHDREFKFEGLIPNETVCIDTERELMKSGFHDSVPFSKFNKGRRKYWLDLVEGVNEIEVVGQCKIKVKSQYPTIW